MSAFDPKRTLKFNFENKNGAARKPRQVVMRNDGHLAETAMIANNFKPIS
jgi:hypothetical protein